MTIPESDWKLLRKIHQTALRRFCERVLAEYREVLDRSSGTPHELFLQLYELNHRRNQELAGAFDDLRRSRGIDRLVAMRRVGVVSDEDLALFSAETRAAVAIREGG